MFQVGDIVIGGERNPYSVTSRGRKCKVVEVKEVKQIGECDIRVVVNPGQGTLYTMPYWVEGRYFKPLERDGGADYGL